MEENISKKQKSYDFQKNIQKNMVTIFLKKTTKNHLIEDLFSNKPCHRVVKELVDAVECVSSHKGESAKRPKRSIYALQHENNMI